MQQWKLNPLFTTRRVLQSSWSAIGHAEFAPRETNQSILFKCRGSINRKSTLRICQTTVVVFLRGCTFHVRPTNNFLAIQSQSKLPFDHHYHSARESLRETRHGMTLHCGSYPLCSPCLIFITCEILSKQIHFQPPDAHLCERFFPNSSLLVFDVCCFVSFGGCNSFPRCTAFCNKKRKRQKCLGGPANNSIQFMPERKLQWKFFFWKDNDSSDFKIHRFRVFVRRKQTEEATRPNWSREGVFFFIWMEQRKCEDSENYFVGLFHGYVLLIGVERNVTSSPDWL